MHFPLFKKLLKILCSHGWTSMIVLCTFSYGMFYGRIPEKSDYDEWIYKEDKAKRTIAFTTFDVIGDKKKSNDQSFEVLGQNLPQIIAMMIKKNFIIEIQKGDFSEKSKQEGSYKIVNFEYENKKIQKDGIEVFEKVLKEEKENNSQEDDDANSELEEKKKKFDIKSFYAKREKKDTFQDNLNATNYAFTKTNEISSNFSVFLYKKEKDKYIDIQDFAPWQIESLKKSGVPVHKDKDGIYYLQVMESSKKKLEVDGNLYKLSNPLALTKLLENKEIDYFIYGTYKNLDQKYFLMSLYFIHPAKKWITNIINKKIGISSIREDIKDIPNAILAFIQGKKIIKNIQFKSKKKEKDALLYLNENFVGKLPLKIDTLTEGEYSFKVWHPKKIFFLDKEQLAEKKSQEENKKEKTIIKIDNNNKNYTLGAQPQDFRSGMLDVQINNKIPAEFYLEGALVKSNSLKYSKSLPVGNYLLKINKENYNTLFFEIPIKKNSTTKLHFPFLPPKKLKPWEKSLFNHDQNSRIFWSLGLIMTGISVASYIETLDLEDQKNATEKKREEEFYANNESLNNYIYDLKKRYSVSLNISAALFFGATLPLLLLATVSYALNIHLDRTKIVTIHDNNGFGLEIKKNLGKKLPKK